MDGTDWIHSTSQGRACTASKFISADSKVIGASRSIRWFRTDIWRVIGSRVFVIHDELPFWWWSYQHKRRWENQASLAISAKSRADEEAEPTAAAATWWDAVKEALWARRMVARQNHASISPVRLKILSTVNISWGIRETTSLTKEIGPSIDVGRPGRRLTKTDAERLKKKPDVELVPRTTADGDRRRSRSIGGHSPAVRLTAWAHPHLQRPSRGCYWDSVSDLLGSLVSGHCPWVWIFRVVVRYTRAETWTRTSWSWDQHINRLTITPHNFTRQ